MYAQLKAEVEIDNSQLGALLGFESETGTLLVDDVEVYVDLQLGDDELGVSLLVESLEQQYRDLINAYAAPDRMLRLQSAKEWVQCHRSNMAGLFRYMNALMSDEN